MRWQPEVLWLHVVADALTAMAYASIPVLLFYVVRKRRDIRFHFVFLAFGGFILACGATHIMSIVTIWKPLYLLEGILKLITGLISIVTAICLARLIPTLLRIPGHAELQEVNEALARSQKEMEFQTAKLQAIYSVQQASTEALRKSEMQFKQLADSMPHIVWTATPDGAVDYFNERWYNFTGFDRKLLGDASWMPLLHSEDVQKRFNAWYASVRSGLPFKEEYRFFDRASGTYRWHLGRALPIRNEAGEIVKWYGGCTDIEDYKAVEAEILALNRNLETRVRERTSELTLANEELCKTQTWLRAIVQSATDVSIMALDNNGIITFFNSGSERMLGYQASDLIGKCTPYMIYPPEQCALRARQLSAELKRPITVDEIFLAVNQPREPIVSEAVYLHRNGSHIEVSLAISPIIDARGERLGKLAIAVDMRPRKELEKDLLRKNIQLQEQTERAEEANRAKSEFLSSMSHEIRTPMNAILGMADLLWESELQDSQRRYVEVFRRACTNLLTLINDLLDLSKIESGHFELEEIEFDLPNAVQLALEMIRPRAEAKGLQVHSLVAADIPTALVGDPLRLQQVLGNLLGNAVKFTDRGFVRLSVESHPHDPNRIRFEVTDTGIGVPAEKLDSIFDDFIQAERSTARRFGGTGLGLGICRRLIRRMGGELRLRSVEGEGSTFYFDAAFSPGSSDRRSPSEITAAPLLKPVALPQSNQRNIRILIADDSEDSRFLMQEYLKNGPYEVVFAENGKVASQMALSLPFDLVLMDVQMPVMDGLTATRLIREEEKATGKKRVALLALTANAAREDIHSSEEAGCDGHLSKPISKKDLLAAIEEFASQDNLEGPTGEVPSIPPGLEAAAKRYIQTRIGEISIFKKLIEEREFAEIHRLAHNIRGTGAAYGFPDISRLGQLMESSSKAQNANDLAQQLIELSRCVQSARNAVLIPA